MSDPNKGGAKLEGIEVVGVDDVRWRVRCDKRARSPCRCLLDPGPMFGKEHPAHGAHRT